jgi:hypothetical protein
MDALMQSIVAHSRGGQNRKRPSIRRFIAFLLSVTLTGLFDCRREAVPPAKIPISFSPPLERTVGQPRPTLLLAKAQFTHRIDAQGRRVPVPGAAKLVLLRETDGLWRRHVLEDPDSMVFHKTIPLPGPGRVEELLTIAGTTAALKVWEVPTAASVTLWQPSFGGKWDRLRDAELGDVDGDGAVDIVVATHDRGVVAVLTRNGASCRVREIDRTAARTFVHEIELGDIDGDGVAEIFATPSQPNRADGVAQAGEIVMYRRTGDAFERKVVDAPTGTHAKEILVVDSYSQGRPRLLAALEARTEGQGPSARVIAPVRIVEYTFDGSAFQRRIVAELADRQCRFLCAGDVNGDGLTDIVASGMNSGVWLLEPRAAGEWTKTLIDAESSGYEHATLVADVDGDGIDEIYVAADRQNSLRRYRWREGAFQRTKLADLSDRAITFHIGFCRL